MFGAYNLLYKVTQGFSCFSLFLKNQTIGASASLGLTLWFHIMYEVGPEANIYFI